MKLKISVFLILCAILLNGFAQKVESDYTQKIDDKVRATQMPRMYEIDYARIYVKKSK
jgi:hypothetical protein